MSQIITTKGMMDLKDLDVTQVPLKLAQGGTAVATEYRHNGELVKRDIAVVIDPSKVKQ